jgi:hypothetical protein
MTRDKIDQLWNRALGQSINAGEAVTRYHFAALVLEEAAKGCEQEHVGESVNDDCDNNGDRAYNLALRHAAASVRAMKPEVKT